MSVLAIITSSHRQTARLPEGRLNYFTSGASRALGTKDRVWYYPDNPEMRAKLAQFRVHKRLSAQASKRYAERSEECGLASVDCKPCQALARPPSPAGFLLPRRLQDAPRVAGVVETSASP